MISFLQLQRTSASSASIAVRRQHASGHVCTLARTRIMWQSMKSSDGSSADCCAGMHSSRKSRTHSELAALNRGGADNSWLGPCRSTQMTVVKKKTSFMQQSFDGTQVTIYIFMQCLDMQCMYGVADTWITLTP